MPTALRILLATAIVAQSAWSFAPSFPDNQQLFMRRTASTNHPVNTQISAIVLQHPSSLQLKSIPHMQRRRRSGLCISQQQNEYTDTTRNISSDLSGTPVSGVIPSDFKEQDHYYETAIRRTVGWVAAAIGFGIALGFFAGSETSEEFFAGYLLEQSLSIDNLLVFLLLFEYFRIPLENQNRILNWGIIGAIVMRATMIGAGAIAIQKFHAVLLVFAAILIFSSGKVIFGGQDDDTEDLSENQIVKFSNSVINSTDKFDGDKFFTEIDGVRKATPMLLCMIAVEISDVVFAVDSIPAVFGVTENPLVVFTSNMFAIMGLRSLYTILSKAASELKYLDKAVAVVLGFIGGKMIAEYFGFELPTEFSVGIVITMLGTGVLASVLDKSEDEDGSQVS
ncbi:integral membrane protein TerC [Nitzschia inconspicua]|uniref:Integral membrane protein TerC n=1 Tax=Nitzschia inconspicua TaxID=303405 RepID=A0A9K3LS36_9STRA|nr:integral membrane protein TerC [Nitzschia inconspicua]